MQARGPRSSVVPAVHLGQRPYDGSGAGRAEEEGGAGRLEALIVTTAVRKLRGWSCWQRQ